MVSSISSEDIKYLLKKLEADIETERQHKPQQIPTITDLREKTSASRSTSFLSGRQSANVRLPDVSRPPPGYAPPIVPSVSVPIPMYQHVSQPLYNYEDNIVSRVLQSIMKNQNLQQLGGEVPCFQS